MKHAPLILHQVHNHPQTRDFDNRVLVYTALENYSGSEGAMETTVEKHAIRNRTQSR